MRAFLLMLIAIATGLSAAGGVTESVRAQPADDASLLISEIMYNPHASGDGLEFLELHNPGTEPMDLSAFTFTAGIDYTFADGASLAAGDYLVLASTFTDFQQKYGFTPFGVYGGRLDNGGESLILRTADGDIWLNQPYNDVAPWPCGADGSVFSLVLIDGAPPVAATGWRLSTKLGGSPVAADPAPAPGLPAIVINEVLAHTDLPLTDAVELHNPSDFDASLAGWFLSDKPDEPRRMQFENGSAIPAGGYLVLDEATLATGGFALSENGETLLLTAADCDGAFAGYRETVTFDASPNGVSLGRHQNSVGELQYPPQITRTLGMTNAGPRVGPVVISAIMYNPADGGDEYIELTNPTDASVLLHHPDYPQLSWRMAGIGDYALPGGMSLAAGERLLISPLTPAAFRTKYSVPANVQIVGPYTGELSNGGERVTLRWPGDPNNDGSQPYMAMDSVKYSDRAPWPTAPDGNGPALARRLLTSYGDDPINWRADDDTGAAIFLPVVFGANGQ